MEFKELLSVRFLSLFILSAIFVRLCPMDGRNNNNVKATPPPWVFGVVWPILYFLIGLSWLRLYKYKYFDILFILNIALLIEWLVVYGCFDHRRWALYTIVMVFGVSFVTMIYAFTKDPVSGFMLSPYVFWLFFATLLSFSSFNNSKKNQ
jgi:tryptophan-rich sensory protein